MAKPGTHGSIDWDAVYTAHGQNFLNNEPVDNYFTGNPTLDYLKADMGDGGADVRGDYLVVPIVHTGQSNVQSVGRLGQASLATTDPITAAQYRLTTYLGHVVIPGIDERRASGMDARLNLVETYVTNLRKSAERTMSQHLWATSQGSTTDIEGLPVLITTAGTGTIGNINSSTYTMWKNKFIDTVTFSSQGLDKMRQMVNDVSAGNQGFRPGLIVTTQTIWEAYVDLAEGKHSIEIGASKGAGRIADLGFPVATYQGIPITWDENCPSGRMYFLNKEGVQFRSTKWELSKFEPLTTAGIDGRVAQLKCYVTTTVTHRRILGQISTIS